uniref:Vomeronasal type-2 receptor 116-like n=1 Tax=Peromyscus maniculatus bairdii TaxID=230844 RepID=A0A8C8UDX6_PERMB
MFTLIFLFFLLNIPLLVASFIHPRCFWRMKQNKFKDGDLLAGCIFFLRVLKEHIEKDYFNYILNTQSPTENIQFPLALTFSLDEVNRNPDLLPNMSLVFHWSKDVCKTVEHHEKTKPTNNGDRGRRIPTQRHRRYIQQDHRRKLAQLKEGNTYEDKRRL